MTKPHIYQSRRASSRLHLRNAEHVCAYLSRNPSDLWVLVVDGLVGTFADKDEAVRWFNLACPEEEYIENSPFGSNVLIPPQYAAGSQDIDLSLAIDIRQYIIKRHQRAALKSEISRYVDMMERKKGQYLRKSGSAWIKLKPQYCDLSGKNITPTHEA